MPFRPGEDASFAIRLLFPSYVRFTSFLFYRPPQSSWRASVNSADLPLPPADGPKTADSWCTSAQTLLPSLHSARYPVSGHKLCRRTLSPRFDPYVSYQPCSSSQHLSCMTSYTICIFSLLSSCLPLFHRKVTLSYRLTILNVKMGHISAKFFKKF